MDDMSSMSAGAAPENTNIAHYLSKRAIAIGGRSAPQGTTSTNSSSATGPFVVPLEQEGRLPCSGFFDQGDRLSPEKRHKEHGRKKTASAAFSMPCLNHHGFDSSCPSGRQGMLSSSGMGKEGVIGAMGPRLHFKASDCNHREQMRKRRSKLCTEHRPCSPSSVPTCSSCLPCSPSACPSSRRTKR